MEAKGTPSKRSIEAIAFAGMCWLLTLVAAGLAVRRWLPPLASEHGAGVDLMIRYLIVTVGGLFVTGHLVLGYFIWRFSHQDRVTYRLPSPKAEKAWSVIPILVMAFVAEGGVLVLGLPVWAKLYATPAPPEAMTVEVTGEQFAWTVRYPGKDALFGRTDPELITDENPLGIDGNDPAARDDLVEPSDLHLPVNRPVRVVLRSKDALHSFFLPHFRIKQDIVPGMSIEVWFVPTEVGEYEIACAELCGLGHYKMRGVVRVLPPEQFEQWLKEREPA